MFIRTGLLTLAISLSLANISEARDSARNYTCNDVKDLIHQRGAVVLDTKNSHVYRRFVASRFYCQLEQITGSYWVPTKSGKCRLKVCIEYDPDAG